MKTLLPGHRHIGARRPPHGVTLLEVAVTLVVIGIVLGIAIPRLQGSIARHAARGAARDVGLLLSTARQIAASSIDGAAVGFDSASGSARLMVSGDTVRTLGLAAVYGVALRATRDSVAYDARGLGYGAANLSVFLTRGAAAETVVISRLGRLRTSFR